jgi:hypothetical protein
MESQEPISLAHIWKCAANVAKRFNPDGEPQSAFHDLGLTLYKAGEEFRYDCTPDNCRVFATTQVDGCHWCLLELGGHEESELPVVFVSPMDDPQHYIAGENLRDFLELGLASRSFDGLGDGLDEDCVDPENEPLWEFLRSELNLAERNDPLPHLTRLHENYFKFLRIPEGT